MFKRIPLLFLGVVLGCSSVVHAQDTSPNRAQWWINVGVGAGPNQHQAASISNFNAGLSYNRQSARLWQVGTNLLFVPLTSEKQSRTLVVLHVALGKTHVTDNFRSSVFIGPGLVGVGDLLFGDNEVTAPGIVANAQLFAIGLPEIGLGVELFGVLNTVRSGVGWRLSVQLNNNRE